MLNIAGYKILEVIHKGQKTVVYRALREADQKRVILKVLNSDYPSLADKAQLKREYDIMCSLHISGIVKAHALENYKNTSILVLEDFGGETLKSIIEKGKLPLKSFLEIAIRLVDILGEIHDQSVIHKDLKPQNILVNPENQLVKISDFSISSLFSRESQKLGIPDQLEGTLAYISPEQTGWMNRIIDYRTDFYTLGITFFEMLSGRLPYTYMDPMELIHAHLAKDTPLLNSIDSDIPVSVSSIVAKLLAKNAEDRYRTSSGLKRDLELCLEYTKSGKPISSFNPGSMDISDRFEIPQKLYGREKEIAILSEAIERASVDTSEMIILSGPSGIGKSVLVQEIGKKVIEHSGFYISGKFEQFNRDIPYYAFIEAFNSLINYILTFNQEKAQLWKEKIIHALGNNAQVILDFIPRLKLVIGDQPQVAALGSRETQNRFHLLFQKFVDLFADNKHLLVIFIDDLQWADSSSIKLIKVLMTNADNRNMVFIGAHRTVKNNTDNTLLNETIQEIENYRHNYNLYFNQKLPVNFIHMGSIDENAITNLLEDTLNSHSENMKQLAELIMHRTAGNPFFINQFLISIYQNGLVHFQKEKNTWEWEIDKIRKRGVTENVVQLMVEKLGSTTDITRHILQLASCIGNQFDLETLSVINENSQEETARQLVEATREEYVLLIDRPEKESDTTDFQFQHDQIRYAAYSTIAEDQKKEIHRKIVDLTMDRMKDRDTSGKRNYEIVQLNSFAKYINNETDLQGLQVWLGDNVFLLVNHLNLSGDFISDPEEIIVIIALNLIAARKARINAAFETALDYLHMVIKRLDSDAWKLNYFLTLSLYNEAADCEYINTNFQESEILCHLILHNAHSVLDRVKVFQIRIANLTPQNKLSEAIESGLAFLRELGVKVSQNPGKLSPLPNLLLNRLKIGNNVERLANLADMTEPEKIAAMNILVQIHAPSFISSPNLTPLVVLELINLSLEYGLSEQSAYGFVCFGMILGSAFGSYSYGHRFGKLAVEVLHKFQPSNMECKVLFLYGNMISHWLRPIAESQKILEEAYYKGLESGDLLFASYALNWINAHNFLMRKPIPVILENLDKYEKGVEKIHQKDAADFFHLWRQFVINLSENNISTKLSGLIFDEQIAVPVWKKTHNDTDLFTYYLFKAILFYLKKDYKSALKFIELSIPHESGVFGMPVIPEHNFFHSIILTSLCFEAKNMQATRSHHNVTTGDSYSAHEIKSWLKQINKNQNKLKVWAKNSPTNYEHKYLIVEAELYRLKNDKNAIFLFEKAIESAQQNKYIFEEALANELLSRYYFANNKPFVGRAYVREAYYQYLNWGAHAKTYEILKEFPEIVLNKSYLMDPSISGSENFTSSTTETLDFKTILKVSQNISSEIELDRLIEKLMTITLENAGAQKGFLILSQADGYYLEAEGKVDSVKIMSSIPVESFPDISQSIINYVKITKEVVVINDISQENQFQSDPYIIRTKPKSILCAPVIKQNKLIAIIYLENNLMPNVFTRRRLDVLNLLTMQAVISLENAMYVEQIRKVNNVLEEEIKMHKKTEEALRSSRERYALAARGANDGLWDWDLLKNEIYFSPRWKEMLGYTENEINSMPDQWFSRVHPEDLSMLKSAMDSHLDGTRSHFECEYRLQHKNGSYLWMITRGLAVRDSFNRPYRLAGSQTEITKRKVAEDQLRHDALHDSLTGLPNWNLLLDRMMHAINRKKRQASYVCCALFLDLDRFKVINDSLGHEAGNALLIEYAKLLQDCITPEDTVARLGGDEFAILLENITDVNEAIKVTNKIRSKLTAPFIIKDVELFITMSIGVVMITNEYQKPEEVLRDADTAMHRAKAEGRNRYQIYDKTMHSMVIGFLKLEGDLRKAIEKKEFLVYYQPIISGDNGGICGVEALVRWNKNNETLIFPGEFIGVAEENGLIVPIGEFVLNEVCRQIKIWQNMNIPNLIVAVNLSPKQFEQEDLLQMIDGALQSSDVKASLLQFELTETVLMRNIPYATNILEGLKRRGIHTSIDDFGIGYSSLNYLKKFPVSKLKIDQSFVQNIISHHSNDKAIIKAIIAMGESMNMRVVAEGVETREQLQFLQDQNCHEFQGYYFSKPLSAEDFTTLIQNQQSFDLKG